MEFGLVDTGVATENNVKSIIYTKLLSIARKQHHPYIGDAMTRVFVPIFDSFDDETKKPVGLVRALIHWGTYFKGILPKHIHGIDFVIDNEFGESYSYRITGDEPRALGSGFLQMPKYDYLARFGTMKDIYVVQDGSLNGVNLDHRANVYSIHVYPSDEMYDDYSTNQPILITFAVLMVFVFTAIMFLVYDRCKYHPSELTINPNPSDV
jgi:hypothetical protein